MRLFATLSLVMFSLVAYSQSDITDKISNAFAKGDAAAIVAHFQSDVDMTVLEDENVYSPSEARKVL